MQALRQGKIPPRRSVAEAILIEMLNRERTERLILAEALIMSHLLSAPKEILSSKFYRHIHKMLAEHIFQTRLESESEQHIIEKVEAMSAYNR